MKRQFSHLKRIPQAALAAVFSLQLALPPCLFADALPATVLTGDNVVNGNNGIIEGHMANGYFVSSGSLTINNATLQNFNTVGGAGSGGGGGFGGALFINSGTTVTLNNVNFLSNNAKGGKGGVGTVGGTLNNLFNNSTGTAPINGTNGYTPSQTMYTDIEGTTGTKGYNGANNTSGFGGNGGNGGAGGNGGDHSPSLILGVTTATLGLVDLLTEEAAANASPFTLNLGLGLLGKIANAVIAESDAIAALAYFDKSLSDGQIGLGGTGGSGGKGGMGSFGYGGGAGGNGANGGAGGSNWGASAYSGGAAGGDAGNGGIGGIGGFGAGGGAGGNGGIGGVGATISASSGTTGSSGSPAQYTIIPYKPAIPYRAAGYDDNGMPSTDPKYANEQPFVPEVPGSTTYTPAVAPVLAQDPRAAGQRASGLDGSAGAGGTGGFGGGVGATGTENGTLTAGGSGGNGYGGAIFVRADATLRITGNAIFDGNGIRGGDGQAADASHTAGASGIGAGSNIFMMTGSTVILDPGAGNVITFNSDAYGTGIADDSAASIIPSGGVAPIQSGAGADIHIASGLVQFNGGNLYSGETILEGGTLQAQDGDGIYWDSNIHFAATTTSNGVLMSNGDFTRYVGIQSNRVQWTGSGGFAAVDGDLNVKLSNGQTMKWGTNSFVPDGSALIFGSAYATNVVNFKNDINLNNGNRTILVTANDAALSGAQANTDYAVLSGVISNGALTIGDASHKGIVVLTGVNTYNDATTINGGGLALAGSGSLPTTAALTLAAGTSFDISAITASSQTIASLSAAAETSIILGAKNLTVGASNDTTVAGVISGEGGSLTKQGTGTLTLTAANTYTGTTKITSGTIALSGSGSLSDTSPVNITGATGTFDISAKTAGSETIGALSGVAGSKVVLGAKNLTTGDASDTTMAGVISGSGGSLTKEGSGKLTLTAANTYTGATTIDEGTLALSGSGSLSDSTAVSVTGGFDISAITASGETVASISSTAGSSIVLGAKNLTAGDSNDTTVAGTISGTGGSFTKTGSGKTTFTGADTYTGATTISGGTLALSAGGSLSDLSAVNITSSTGVFDISDITASSETIASIAGVAGSQVLLGAKNLTAGDASNTTMAGVISGEGGSLTKQGTGKLTLSAANTYTSDTTIAKGTLALSGAGSLADSTAVSLTDASSIFDISAKTDSSETIASIASVASSSIILGAKNLTAGDSTNTTVAGTISGTGGSFTKTGSGTTTFTAADTYTGATTITDGTLALSAGGSLSDLSAVNITGATGKFDISAKTDGSETIASIAGVAGSQVLLGAKNLTAGDASNTTMAGVISGTNGSLTKQGTGTLTLTGANTYTGATTITAGKVTLSAGGSLADTSPVNITGATGKFDISAITASSETIGSIAGVAGSTVELGAKNLTAGAAADTTMAGVISGTGGSFTKDGSGKLTLTAANTYTSDTTIAKGTLALVDAGSLVDSTAVKLTDATSVFDISAKTAGSETIASISSVAESSIALGAKNLTAGDSNDTTVAGTISGTGGSFTKTGSGKTTFTGADTYTGATTISGGTLALSAGGSLSDLSAVNITSSTGVFDISDITASSETIASIAGVAGSQVLLGAKNLTAGDASNTTMAGVISGTNGSLTKQGTGKLTLSGANTYTGDTTVNAGILETSGNERLANDSDLIVASGATFRLGGNEVLNSIAGAGNIELQSYSLASYTSADTTFSGVISGTDASILSKTGTGKLTLSGDNTYTGITNFSAGSADLTGSLASKTVNVASGFTLDSKTGGLSSSAELNNNGTINLGPTDDTVKSYTSTGTLNGPGVLTAQTYNLNDGSVIKTSLGAGTVTTNGTVDLYGTSAAATIVINASSVLNLKAPELLLNSATVTVNGTLNLDYSPAGTETIHTLLGSGTIHTNGNSLIVADGGSFTGTLDATGTSLITGGGTGGTGGGGGLTLGGGTTTTQSTEIDSTLTIANGATLNSATITIANGSTLDLSGGGTIIFTNLTSLDKTGGIINIGAHDFVIPAGSTISGWITFVGTGKVINNGTISPGFSPAIAVIPAAFVDGPGSITKLELAGTGGVAGADFDQLRVTTTLEANGTLNVAHYGGFISKQGDSFQVLSDGTGAAVAAGAITGSFTTVTFDNDGFAPPGGPNVSVTPTAAFVLDLDTGKLTTTGLTNPTDTYADLGSNANQRGAAASIFAAATAGVGPSQIRTSTTAGFLAQQITDATGGSSADLARYTPDYYGSLADSAFMGNQVLVRSIQDRVSPMTYIPSGISEDSLSQVPETMSLFIGYTYANMNTADSAKATRNDYYAGVNLLASEDYVFGIAGSMSQGSITASLGNAKSDGWGAMVFGRYTVARSFTFFGSFGFNQQSMDVRRQTVNGTVTGSTDVTSYVAFLGVQYKGWRVGGVSIAPRVSLSYSNSQVAGFSESGAIDALNVSGYHNNRFMGEAGLSALWSTDLAGHVFNLEVAASVQQYFQNTKSQMAVNVASVPSASYGVNFAKNGSTQGVVQVNAGYELAKRVTTYLGYEGHFGNQSTQYAKAGLRVNF